MTTYSYTVTTDIFSYPFNSTEFKVYEFLRASAKRTNYTYCYPSMKTIANAIGKSIRTAQRCIQSLMDKLYLHVVPEYQILSDGVARQTSNTYYFVYPISTEIQQVVSDKNVTLPMTAVSSQERKSFKSLSTEKREEVENKQSLSKKTTPPEETTPSMEQSYFVERATTHFGASKTSIDSLITRIKWENYNVPVIKQACDMFFARMVGKVVPHYGQTVPTTDEWMRQRRYEPIYHPIAWMKTTLEQLQLVYEVNFRTASVARNHAETNVDYDAIRDFEELFQNRTSQN